MENNPGSLDTFHDRIRLIQWCLLVDRSCDLRWMRWSFKDERKLRQITLQNNGTEQMDGNVFGLLFLVFLFGHLLWLILKWRHLFQERSGEIMRNPLIKPDYQPEVSSRLRDHSQKHSLFHNNFHSWGLWNRILHIFGQIYLVLSSPVEQPVVSVGSSAAKNHCSAPGKFLITHLGAEIAAELAAWWTWITRAPERSIDNNIMIIIYW